jgi:uncharacterized membrane protein (UPF0127 family)
MSSHTPTTTTRKQPRYDFHVSNSRTQRGMFLAVVRRDGRPIWQRTFYSTLDAIYFAKSHIVALQATDAPPANDGDPAT